jgi:hypothetical protein
MRTRSAGADDGEDLVDVVATLAEIYGLDVEEEDTVLVLAEIHDEAQALLADVIVGALDRGDDPSDPDLFRVQTPLIVSALAELLDAAELDLNLIGRPAVAEALATVALGGDDAGTLGLQLLVEALKARVTYQTRTAVAWLEGRGADRAGYGLDAEAAYERAVSLDASWPPALESLAGVAADRGDTERALALLDRAGMDPQDGAYRLLLAYRPEAGQAVRRNDPCWCGSGRALKRCHRTNPPLPLARRASWLYHKASAFLQDGPWRGEVLALAQERARYSGRDGLLQALDDPLVMSSMLFEGGVLERFAETRGPLLPEDELALLGRWLAVSRGLFQVEGVRRDEGLEVRNVLDGSRAFVREVLGSRQAHEGMLFVSLALPVDDRDFGFFGGIEPIGLHQRETVISLLDSRPAPLDLVALMTDRLAPPTFTTTDGEPMEACTTVVRVRGRAGFIRALDRQFTRSGPNSWTAGIDGGMVEEGDTVGGTLEAKGREITITAMNRARMDLLLAVIDDIGLDVVVESRGVMDPLTALAREPEHAPVEDDRATSPEALAILDDYIRQYERDWLDMDIPALGGLTPRRAAADPIARGDLISLINSMPAGIPGTMDPSRLRAALGLAGPTRPDILP